MQATNRESVICLAYFVFDYLGKAKNGRDRQTETSEENRKEKEEKRKRKEKEKEERKVFGGARLLT